MSKQSYAIDFYKDCVKSYQFTDHDTDPIELTPLNKICVDRCRAECGAFSRTALSSNDPDDMGVELNSDVISNCMSVCKAGQLFTSTYYEAKPRNSLSDPLEMESMPPASTAASCTEPIEWVKNSAVRVAFKINSGDLVTISLSGKEGSNKVYLCGNKSLTLIPTFPNINSKTFDIKTTDWNKNTPPQTEWAQQSDHKCFQNLTSAQWSSMTNQKLWQNYINDSAYGECSWSARNANFVDTKIPVGDGDELILEWSGNYSLWGSGLSGRKELMQCLNYELDAAKRDNCRYRLNFDTTIVVKNPAQASFNFSSSGNTLFAGEEARPKNHYFGIRLPESETPPEVPTKHGLKGRFMDMGIVTEFNSTKCDASKEKDYERPECVNILDFGTTIYSYSGIVKDFGSNRSNMGVGYWDDGKNLYVDNHGGLNLTIKWGGCAFLDGKGAQYAIFPEQSAISSPYDNIPSIPEGYWKDIPEDTLLKNKPLELGTQQGSLFLRIKPLSSPVGASGEIAELFSNPKNFSGQYYVIVERVKASDVKLQDGPFTRIIKTVRHVLLGKDRAFGTIAEEGVIYNMYTGLVYNTRFITFTRSIILLYISFLGVGFLFGLSNINQRDLLMKLLKIAAIFALISPGSWEFFCGYLIPLCIDGVMELIAIFVAGSYPIASAGYLEEEILKNPEHIFELFDGPLQQLFSAATWKKIVALLFSGLAGIMLTIAILISIFYYLCMLVKAVLLYLISIVFMSVLIMTGPIFIITSIFEITKHVFSQWVKFLISFALQPLAVMILFALFNLLLAALLNMALGFSACPACLLYVDLIFYKACWIPYFTPVLNAHLPPGIGNTAFMSPANVGIVLAFLLVSNGAFVLINHIVVIISNITTGSFLRTVTIAAPTQEGVRIGHGTVSDTSRFGSGAARNLMGMGARGARRSGAIGAGAAATATIRGGSGTAAPDAGAGDSGASGATPTTPTNPTNPTNPTTPDTSGRN